MRTFYNFNISKEMAVITKDCPYNLYKTLESVYYLDKCDLDLGYSLFEQVTYPFKIKETNLYLNESFKDNDFYTSFNNHHKIYNKYNDDYLEIDLHHAYMQIKTNMNKKSIFQKLSLSPHLFVCDFQNKDYF